MGMLELPMAALRPHLCPAVVLEQLDSFTYLHRHDWDLLYFTAMVAPGWLAAEPTVSVTGSTPGGA
jgi:hypothetical protein